MTERDAAVRAVVETLRYIAGLYDYTERLSPVAWADQVERLAAVSDWACCPCCSEVDCDDDCPLRHWRD